MTRTRPTLSRGLAACLGSRRLAAVPLVAQAQQTDQGAQGALQEVIVTAQKRVANLQDVPFSVSSTSQDQIRNYGAENLIDLARNVAGLAIADLGPGQSQMAIRGISSGQVIRDQPGLKEQVGVYLDESPISVALFTPDLELFDLDRFEVLRGPQGTLFGAGSEAGTVRYITRQPQLGKFEAFTDASFEDVAHGDQGGMVRGALNVPLGDAAAARIDLYWHHLPGFIDAIQPGGGVKKAVNDGDRTGARHRAPGQADRRAIHHPARRVPEPDHQRFPAGRSVQHSREPLHDGGADHHRQPRAVHPAARGPARPVPAERSEGRLQLSGPRHSRRSPLTHIARCACCATRAS